MLHWPRMDTKKKAQRGSKGEGTLFKRGRMRHYKAPNGERFATDTQVKSEADPPSANCSAAFAAAS
jgi:hypothetical protein